MQTVVAAKVRVRCQYWWLIHSANYTDNKNL